MKRQERADYIDRRLEELYPQVPIPLRHDDPYTLLVAVLFFGSLQLISVGLLGEYIGRIYLESKGRPIYLIRRRYGADGAS